ncbi:MAG: Unknown protein [uncultured Sulfurovum sp.]|uniref:adenosine deaminase n=1 Tax=uncultured Sulfurovum sp. TaxID=269237 RepID=A0A6S6SKW0_9BACT|nr:MAG: Unknown protein [uncultured Sulfurovum sp.]
MPLKKTTKKHIALINFLYSYQSVEKELKKVLYPQYKNLEDGIFDFMIHNNPSEHYLYLEDSYDELTHNYAKDFVKICRYFAKTHYKLDANHTVFVKKNYVEDLKLIESSLDNFLIEGFFIYEASRNYKKSDSHRFLDKNVYTDKFTQSSAVHKLDSLSDLHMHLGAGMRVEYRVHSMLINPNIINVHKLPKSTTIELNNAELSIKNLVLSLSVLEQVLITGIIDKSDAYKDVVEVLSLIDSENFFLLRDRHDDYLQLRTDEHLYVSQEDNYLLYAASQHFIQGKIIYADRFLMLVFIEQLFISKLPSVVSAIKIYLTMRNMLKSYLIQQHQRTGLGYFSTYSKSTLRRSLAKKEKEDIIYSLSNLSNQLHKPLYIEARITPQNKAKAIYEDLCDYVKVFENMHNEKLKLKFIYHFIKRKNDISKQRFEALKLSLKKESLALVEFLSNTHYDFDIRSYVAGIDAASKEYHTPPYVYAPIYRYFKSSKKLSSFYMKHEMPYSYEQDVERHTFNEQISLKYTYHVGEDFRDLISGIRSIFEAVLFLNLRDGDRLGHAVALGLSSKNFYERIGSVQLSYEELFNNMIFVYYMLEMHESINPEIQKYKSYAKQTILETGNYIYQDLEGTFLIDDYIDAWFLRRNCFVELDTMIERFNIKDLQELEQYKDCLIIPDTDYLVAALPDFFEVDIDEKNRYEKRYHSVRFNKNAFNIYKAYMSDYKGREKESIKKGYVINRGQKIYNKKILHSIETIDYLQELVKLHIIKKRSISIEVMPTSNLLISHIHTHEEHPMYDFKPIHNKENDEIQIFIASDNPMLQNTNIAKEYDYVYNYLKNKYGDKTAYEYLNKIAKDAKKEFLGN